MFHKSVFLCQTSFSFQRVIYLLLYYMKKHYYFAILQFYMVFRLLSQTTGKDYTWLKQGIETAALQLKFTVAEIGDSIRLPRSIWTGYDTDFYVVSWIRNS